MTATLTETKTLTKSDALAMLAAATEHKGRNYKYSDEFGVNADCKYVDNTWDERQAVTDEDGYYEDLPWDTTPPHPACIVGVGLNLQGVSVKSIIEINDDALPLLAGFSPVALYHEEITALRIDRPIEFYSRVLLRRADDNPLETVGLHATEAAARVLWAAQATQDADKTWGEAYDMALAVADVVEGE